MENHGILKLILIPAILCLIAIEPARSSDPVYDGKTLSEWLAELHSRPHGDESQWEKWGSGTAIEQKRRRDEYAIRQIGTNGIPTLLDILSITEKNKKKVLSRIESKQLKLEFGRKEDALAPLVDLAVEGFAILGTDAEPAIPQLDKMLHKYDENVAYVADALNYIGSKGLIVLTNTMSEKGCPAYARGAIIQVLGQRGSGDPKIITQILMVALKDPDQSNRGAAAMLLGGRDAAAIPALIELLDSDSTNYVVISDVARGLSSFGSAAKAAVPKLLSIYTNETVQSENHLARSWAVTLMWALKAIDTNAAAEAETFLVSSSPLSPARFGYTRTRLKNGKELIVGGYIHTEIPMISNRHVASAQLYDSITGKWEEKGEMSTDRDGHTATLLRDGRVLVAGGSDSKGGALASAELYDPATGKWTKTGSLNAGRFSHTAILQSDGKVLVSRGHNGREPLSSCELYDPATEKWTFVSPK
jgi:hypothetical protein